MSRQWWHPVRVPLSNPVSSLDWPILSQMFVKVDCMAVWFYFIVTGGWGWVNILYGVCHNSRVAEIQQRQLAPSCEKQTIFLCDCTDRDHCFCENVTKCLIFMKIEITHLYWICAIDYKNQCVVVVLISTYISIPKGHVNVFFCLKLIDQCTIAYML